jgi:hypothetical protein
MPTRERAVSVVKSCHADVVIKRGNSLPNPKESVVKGILHGGLVDRLMENAVM